MSFTSIEFILFLPAVFIVYWALGRWQRLQNLFLLAASYVFYGWCDWRFLGLIVLSSLMAWGCSLAMGRMSDGSVRRWVNIANIVLNIGILAVFKYYNFFAGALGFTTAQIVLPIGISFYTFQAIGYSVDVYKRRVTPTTDIVAFLTFMAFFPKVVSGPIERGNTLLPQLLGVRRFDYSRAVDGLRQMLWGFFKKLIIADSCAAVVDAAWADYGSYSSLGLLVACVLFSFQVYCDLSGYTDIALGASRLLGIELSRNFNLPYFAQNIPEFWRRWHMSLMQWFRDYIYFPMGGSRCPRWRTVVNTLTVFLVSGLWHGADWSFISYGLYHGLLCSMFVVMKWKSRVITFTLVTLGRIMFRADSLGQAGDYFSHMASLSAGVTAGLWLLPLCAALMVVEWVQRDKSHVLQLGGSRPLRWALYLVLTLIIIFGRQGSHEFIYYQF